MAIFHCYVSSPEGILIYPNMSKSMVLLTWTYRYRWMVGWGKAGPVFLNSTESRRPYKWFPRESWLEREKMDSDIMVSLSTVFTQLPRQTVRTHDPWQIYHCDGGNQNSPVMQSWMGGSCHDHYIYIYIICPPSSNEQNQSHESWKGLALRSKSW